MPNLSEHPISTENVFSGVLLDVHRDVVRTPNGREAVREWIDHPGASAVIPVFEDGTTLLLKQYRYPARQTFLEVPAGKIDPGESPEEAAARELEEETGYRAGRLVSLGSFFPCIGYSNEEIHFFLALDLEQGERQPESDEFLETIILPLLQAVEWGREGKIGDMKTALGLARSLRSLQDATL